VKNEQSRGIFGQAQFLGRAHHAARRFATDLRLLYYEVAGQNGAGQRHGNSIADGVILRATDDCLYSQNLSERDRANRQLVGVGMLVARENLAHDDVGQLWRTGADDVFDFKAEEGDSAADFVGRAFQGDVVAEPVERNFHRMGLRQTASGSADRFGRITDIIDAVEHREALQAHAERIAGPNLGVIADAGKDRGINHTAAADFNPFFFDFRQMLGAQIHLKARFRVAKIVRAETGFRLLAQQRLKNVVQKGLQVANGDVLVHIEALQLVEICRMRGVGGIAPIDPARRNDPDRRLTFEHRADLHGGRVRAEEILLAGIFLRDVGETGILGQVECVLCIPRRMIRGRIERVEAVILGLDFRDRRLR